MSITPLLENIYSLLSAGLVRLTAGRLVSAVPEVDYGAPPSIGTPPWALAGGGPAYMWRPSALALDDGATVSTWTDSVAGVVNTAVSAGAVFRASHPDFGGRPCVEFTAIAQRLRGTLPANLSNQSLTIIAIVKGAGYAGGSGSIAGLSYSGGSGYGTFALTNNGYPQLYDQTSTANNIGTGGPDEPMDATFVAGSYGASSSITQVGEIQASGAAVTPLVNTFNLISVGGDYYGQGGTSLLADLFVYNRNVSSAEMTSVRKWANNYYGLGRQPSTNRTLVCCTGDSRTFGYNLSKTYQSTPSQLQALIGGFANVKNYGIGGATVATITTDQTNRVMQMFSAARAKNIVTVEIGTNMKGFSQSAFNTALSTLCTAYRSKGVIVGLSTIPGNNGGTSATPSELALFNASIRAAGPGGGGTQYADFIIEQAFDPRVGPTPSAGNVYYQIDLTHETTLGCQVKAENQYHAIRAYLGLPGPWRTAGYTTDATQTVIKTFAVPSGSQGVIQLTANVERLDSGTEDAIVQKAYRFRNDAGTITLTDISTNLGISTYYNTLSTASLALAANATAGLIDLKITGEASKTLGWYVWVDNKRMAA